MLMFDSAGDFVGKARDANLARAKQLGASVISCYVRGNPGGMPHATAGDVQAILAHGMGAYGNAEWAADFFRGASAEQCRAAGIEAGQAMGDLGFTPGSVLAASWDYDVLDGDYPAQLAKGRAFVAGLGDRWRFSAYSELGLIKVFVDNHLIPAGVKGWLCMSEGFGHFNDYNWQPYVAVVQQHDAGKRWLNPTQPGTDINTILDPHALGAMWPNGSPYGDDMPSADEIAAAVWNHQLHNVGADDKTPSSGNHPASSWVTHGAVNAAVAAAQHGEPGAVDVAKLADQLAAALGPDLGKQLVAALGQKLA